MRISAVCAVCVDEQIAKKEQPRPTILEGALDDSGFARVNCPHGHESITVFDSRRYHILANSAARAYVDGYTNEVIAVIGTAVERAQEFYIKVSSRAKGLPADSIKSAWASISAQSERQLGAFYFMYLLDNESHLPTIRKHVELRNSVVHRGKIASDQECLVYATYSYDRILKIERVLTERFADFAAQEAQDEINQQIALIPAGTSHITLKPMLVQVDNQTKQVVGLASSFLDVAVGIVNARRHGISL